MKCVHSPNLRLLAVAVMAMGAMACTPTKFHVGGQSTAAAESARLRLEVADLQKETAALQARLRASEQENANLRLGQDGRKLPAGVVVPMAVRLELGSLSGPVNTDPEASINAEQKGIFDTLRLYVTPRDQLGRLLPVAATARVRLLGVQKTGQEVQVLSDKAWNADAFAKAWRDNLTGVHFRLEMPLPKQMPKSWMAQVEVEDLVTGQVLKVEKVF